MAGMKFDFGNPAPQAKTLDEAQQIIDVLWDVMVGYQASHQALASKIADLEEKLKTNSNNSSKSPSSDWFTKKKKKKKYHGPGKHQALKQGAQPGHEGAGRPLLPPEAVDDTVVCLPQPTCECGGSIKANGDKIKRHQQVELPEIKPIVTEYQQVYGVCCGCGASHCGRLPDGVANTLLGPRATASIAIFTGDYRLSKRQTQQLFGDFFNLPVSLGAISNAEEVVSNALAQPVEEAKAYIRQQPVVHADETSHKQQGDKRWMWLATTLEVAVFIICSTRCMTAAKALLGEDFLGILISDRYAAYNWIKTTCRQFCWAHLKRDFQKVSERSGQAGKIGDQILGHIRRMFCLWRRLKDEEINRLTFQLAMLSIRSDMERLLEEGTVCGHQKTENTCQKILRHKQALWTFVDIDGVEPTNNLAEQQLRPYVLWRKSSFGSQSERGNRFVERMMTTTATCKLQGRNRYGYITAAVTAQLKNEAIPSLLPAKEEFEAVKLAA